MDAPSVDTDMPESRANQTQSLLLTAVLAIVSGGSVGAGAYHLKAPEIESRLDRLEQTKMLMEYQIEQLRQRKNRCQGDKYSALADQEGVKVEWIE